MFLGLMRMLETVSTQQDVSEWVASNFMDPKEFEVGDGDSIYAK
jgi:hypothetical protein